MSQRDEKTEVSDNGLRYRSKKAGSPFGETSGLHSALSCFFCGTHRMPSLRVMQKVLGKHQPVCEPPCERNPKSRRKAAEAEAAQQQPGE